MQRPITAEDVEAHVHCPRKAFLLLRGGQQPAPHEYQEIVESQIAANREAYRSRVAGGEGGEAVRSPEDLTAGRKTLLDIVLTVDGLEARCDALLRVRGPSVLGVHRYEPVRVVGVNRPTKSQIVGLAYLGYVLSQVQGHLPAVGTLIRLGDRPCQIKLAGIYKEVRRAVEFLRAWTLESADPPPAVLNKHCPGCPFRRSCLEQAEKDDSLSLLDRMTPKVTRKYRAKGILTVNQLSHVFKPRRNRRRGRRPVRHNLELQALALRTGRTYVEHLPELPRGPVELVVDIEGVPDRDSYYLIGLLVYRDGEPQYLSFWADSAEDERKMWLDFNDRLEALPDAPVYHYGGYERKAFAALARRYGKGQELAGRLFNVASCVYGKVYFPVRSNSLKMLGRFLGGVWTSTEASGLQSLVWRHRWEATRNEQHLQSLLQYNREDCEAVRLLVNRLARIREDAASDPAIDFAHHPKQGATEAGKEVHRQFELILKSAQGESHRQRGVRIRENELWADGPKKKGAPKGHQAYRRMIPSKTARSVRVSPKRKCPLGHGDLIHDGQSLAERTVVDLAFARNGCRKTVTRYVGIKGYCPQCHRNFEPPALGRLGTYAFGHGFQAWSVYQRVVLRLPYRIIAQVTEHLFGVGVSTASVVNFLRYLAGYYAPTEGAILGKILDSDFVHVDETRINVQGVDHYVWVFTDGQHVAFRMTETRETDIVREVLAGYKGILVSDFYPGYDAVPCLQQKCLVHLIGDINDDLWKAPFDGELEAFALEFRSLLVPILEDVERYGLKAWHLRKFSKHVECFYARSVVGRDYTSELVIKYQKRLVRYRDSLFTFLGQDGIPWNNNMAERAIRQLAVQRKISGSFFKRAASDYLLLLAIAQTCRFQDKSYLKFLLSKEKNVDAFRRARPIRYSAPVGGRDPERAATPGVGGKGKKATAGSAPGSRPQARAVPSRSLGRRSSP